MAKPWTPIDATRVGSFVQQGYGQGTGPDYRPWIDEDQVWRRKPVVMLKGATAGRVHYLTGDLAYPYFCIVEWSSMVMDIREQFPLLPLEETIEIARELGIRHPVHWQTKKPIALVTDFLLTVKQDGGGILHARALASVASLDDQRGIEILEIERRYWAARNVDWGIATEREIPMDFASNVDILHAHMINDISSYLHGESRARLPELARLLTQIVQEQRDQPLNHLTHLCDTRLGCEPGTSLAVAYHLLASRQWRIDMHVPINPHQPLHLLAAAAGSAEGRGVSD